MFEVIKNSQFDESNFKELQNLWYEGRYKEVRFFGERYMYIYIYAGTKIGIVLANEEFQCSLGKKIAEKLVYD